MYRLAKVGADCEVFLRDEVGNSVPVVGLLGGTKKNPRPIKILKRAGFCVQEDNVMAEFNIPPAEDVDDFVDSIDKMLDYLGKYFYHRAQHLGSDVLELDISPSRLFSARDLSSDQAKEIGCEPDLCVWTKTENKIHPFHPLLKEMRTAGGHIHTTYTIDGKSPAMFDEEVTENFVKMQDLYLGVPSVILDRDTRRKQLYGRAGAFRYKNYGADDDGHEYRVLSNFWLQSTSSIAWVFRQTEQCIEMLNANVIEFNDDLGARIQTCINTNNVEMAEKLCEEYGIAY